MAAVMLALSSTDAVLERLAAGKDIALEAYTVHGPILRAIEAAARRGAHVAVRLEARPFEDAKLAAENARLTKELRADGADATLQEGLHAKEISIDGTLFLDEKNWHAGDVVLSDDDPAEAASIPQTKRMALEQEAQLLAGARTGDRVIVESESFGSGNAVYWQLKKLAESGAAPRLLVSERDLRGDRRERRILEDLIRDGVRVRVCKDSAKLAAAGDSVWLGSANATYAGGKWDMTDWGLRTNRAAIVETVRSRLDEQWNRAKELTTRTA